MTAVEYRRLLGLLLLWAVLPLPFLYIVQPPFWLAAAAVGLAAAVVPGRPVRLPGWALNVLGIGIIIAVASAGGLRIGPLRPLGHLLLLLTAVRALVVDDRRSFLRALLPVSLVWVVAVTSSTHLAVVPYFALSAAVWWWTGMRVLLAGTAAGAGVRATVPRPRHAAAAAAVALVLAAAIFVIMPRLRSPWVAGRGGTGSVTGFTSHVELGGVGAIRQSPEVAMVVRSVSGEPLEARWMRLRATALERVTLDSWAPRGANDMPQVVEGRVWPFGRRWSLASTVELEIELEQPRRYLFLPEGTVALAAPVAVRLDPAGGVALATRVRGPLTYSVWVSRGEAPRPTDSPPLSLPRFEPDPAVRRLTETIVAGRTSAAARAAAIEDHLQRNFRYAMSGMTYLRADPVAWFLLHERAGHCEYFAGAMVAMLADLGIPARMVTGYSGGALSPDGDRAVVREANAHAWVEARVGPGDEWTTFDPTPAAEVPALSRPTRGERLRWALEWVQSGWDRYVLTYGFTEQMRLLTGLSGVLGDAVQRWSWRLAAGLAAVVAVVVGVFIAPRRRFGLRRRRAEASSPAARAMDRLARRLRRRGVEVPPRATVRFIADRARSLWPRAGGAFGSLAWLAERELYDEPAAAPDPARVRALWTEARREMRQ